MNASIFTPDENQCAPFKKSSTIIFNGTSCKPVSAIFDVSPLDVSKYIIKLIGHGQDYADHFEFTDMKYYFIDEMKVIYRDFDINFTGFCLLILFFSSSKQKNENLLHCLNKLNYSGFIVDNEKKAEIFDMARDIQTLLMMVNLDLSDDIENIGVVAKLKASIKFTEKIMTYTRCVK